MYQRILVPLDGSALSEHALPFAASLARQHRSEIVLVRAVEVQLPPGGDLLHAQKRAVHHAQKYLESLAARLIVGKAPEVAVYCGPPAAGILEQIVLYCADLVVMSTHSRIGVSRLILGSVTDHILRHARVPVLLIPAACEHKWDPGQLGNFGRTTHVLVPLDGSRHAARALGAARAVIEGVPSKVTLLKVIELPAGTQPHNLAEEISKQEEYLHAQARSLSDIAEVRTSVEVGSPVDCIVERAQDRKADLVVMASHGRGGLTRFVMGSVAESVLHRLDVPLLIVRPDPAFGPEPYPERNDHHDEALPSQAKPVLDAVA